MDNYDYDWDDPDLAEIRAISAAARPLSHEERLRIEEEDQAAALAAARPHFELAEKWAQVISQDTGEFVYPSVKVKVSGLWFVVDTTDETVRRLEECPGFRKPGPSMVSDISFL